MPAIKSQTGTSKWSKGKLIKYTFFVFLLIFFLLELIFRFLFFINNNGFHTTIKIQGGPLQTSDSVLIWRNQPFYLDYEGKFQNNEEGMRSSVKDVYIPVKKSNDFWVLLTGASAMEGMGSNRNGEWIDITGVEDHPYSETIGYYLQQMLQVELPDKKIKVFNAATSGYTIYQSFYSYEVLSKKINADWIISMDGVNEPVLLNKKESTLDLLKNDWNKNPQFHSPLKFIIALTTHSALINSIKQNLFHIKQTYRANRNKQAKYPIRQKWIAMSPPSVQFATPDEMVQRTMGNFNTIIKRYDSSLTAAGKKHLLLIQPHMSLRDTTDLAHEEKAVNHYYRALYNDSLVNTFMKLIHQQFAGNQQITGKNIFSMDAVHRWKGWVFVDYCHFTKQANKKIAAEIKRYILSNGHSPVFTE
jgi:hypothetical protein